MQHKFLYILKQMKANTHLHASQKNPQTITIHLDVSVVLRPAMTCAKKLPLMTFSHWAAVWLIINSQNVKLWQKQVSRRCLDVTFSCHPQFTTIAVVVECKQIFLHSNWFIVFSFQWNKDVFTPGNWSLDQLKNWYFPAPRPVITQPVIMSWWNWCLFFLKNKTS